MRATLLVVGFVVLLAPASAAHASATDVPLEMYLATDLLDFDYREFDRDGSELNHESGLLPGLRLGTRADAGRLYALFDLSLHDATVDYDGLTQSGRPVDTNTRTRLVAAGVELGRWFGALPGRWAMYLRLDRLHWGRSIQGVGRVQGLSERYRWSELGLGLRRVWGSGGAWRHELSLGVFRVQDGEVHVALSRVPGRAWDDVTLDLGQETGMQLRYSATRRYGGGHALRIEPYFGYREFGRSQTRAITSGGADTGLTVTEPRSESRRIGIAVGLVF